MGDGVDIVEGFSSCSFGIGKLSIFLIDILLILLLVAFF